jgi:hypothetical protein
MLLGCLGGGPSSGDVKEAVLREIAPRSTFHWVKEVDIIKIGKPYAFGNVTFWPAKAYLIGGERRHEVQLKFIRTSSGNGEQ